MPVLQIVSAVNSKKITRKGDRVTIRDVVPVVDDIVMNGILYPAKEVKAATLSLNSVPAPSGHPRDEAGNYVSASTGGALLNDYIGVVVTNARHDGKRSLVDLVVNVNQAMAHPDGIELMKRVDSAIAGNVIEPIHVSTGVMLKKMTKTGTSKGKAYNAEASSMTYDHVAILLHEAGAGTPEEGVGLFLNSEGATEPVEKVYLTNEEEAEDKRSIGLMKWVKALFGNSSDLSFDNIRDKLQEAIGGWDGDRYIVEVYDKYFIYRDGDKLYKQDYAISSEDAVQLMSSTIQVERVVDYEEVTTNTTKVDTMKEKILFALNAAGIATEGLDESALMSAYNSLITKPFEAKLIEANGKLAAVEVAANAAKDAELTAVATTLAANSQLTVDELKSLGMDRLKELSAKAAPLVANTQAASASTMPAFEQF